MTTLFYILVKPEVGYLTYFYLKILLGEDTFPRIHLTARHWCFPPDYFQYMGSTPYPPDYFCTRSMFSPKLSSKNGVDTLSPRLLFINYTGLMPIPPDYLQYLESKPYPPDYRQMGLTLFPPRHGGDAVSPRHEVDAVSPRQSSIHRLTLYPQDNFQMGSTLLPWQTTEAVSPKTIFNTRGWCYSPLTNFWVGSTLYTLYALASSSSDSEVKSLMVCITKTHLFKYTENFTTKNWVFRIW